MKLKMLALMACFLAMPVVSGAQDTMAKDSTMSAKQGDKGMKKGMKKAAKKDDMDMKKDDMDMKDSSSAMNDDNHGRKTRARGSRRSARGMEMNNSHMNTAPGAECARGCPTSKGAGGLTGVQFLALQQELRDRGCGNVHVTGVLDGPTRAAIKSCAKKWDVEATPAAVLNKMNIGFTAGS